MTMDIKINPQDITPIGWQGAAQHTYTTACDGLHEPGPCPPGQPPVTIAYPAAPQRR